MWHVMWWGSGTRISTLGPVEPWMGVVWRTANAAWSMPTLKAETASGEPFEEGPHPETNIGEGCPRMHATGSDGEFQPAARVSWGRGGGCPLVEEGPPTCMQPRQRGGTPTGGEGFLEGWGLPTSSSLELSPSSQSS